jgi:nucleoside-diphosphate kinase
MSLNQNEATFVFVKPHAYDQRHIIANMISKRDLGIVVQKDYVFTEAKAKQHYLEHIDKPYFDDILQMATWGPSYAMIVYGKNAIDEMSNVAGKTDPKEAGRDTIRYAFGLDKCMNAVHRSDSYASAKREIRMHFSDEEIPVKIKNVISSYPDHA